MYNAEIKIDNKELFSLLDTGRVEERDRSFLKFEKNKIIINAKDITAFKATINGVIKLIETYEKTSQAIKDGNE